ncbi:zinc transporter family protein [Sporosarcina sp. G11-34]|nr:zinc transporter family protein [Sporosarcina sp. G11-34]
MSIIILGGFLFFSVSIGGGLAWLVSKVFRNTYEGLALLCGGFLVGLLVLDIIPTALQMYHFSVLVIGLFIGWVLFLLLHNLFHSSKSKMPSLPLLAIGILLHTIPISMTIGNLLGDSTFGATITTSTILHHLPEGFAFASAFISQGKKLWGLFLCFIGLSIFFSVFVWVGHHVNLTVKAESILMGVSIILIACTSISEFILTNLRLVSTKFFLLCLLTGYLLSNLFHLFL